MAQMKKSEFKALVKECVRECLREIMKEQINPAGLSLQEMIVPRQTQLPAIINPMDDDQMRLRQELAQKGMIQQQLQQRSKKSLAGAYSSYDAEPEVGYMNPSDRLRFAGPPKVDLERYQRPVTSGQRLDPALDVDSTGNMRPPDPNVMRSIFEHTAQTTYKSQAAAGHIRPSSAPGGGGGESFMPPVDKFAEIVAKNNPEDLFAGAANWGALAFR